MKNTKLRKLREPAMRKFLVDWLIKCEVCKYEEYPNSVFYEYNGETIFELYEVLNNNNRYRFYVKYNKIWSVFYHKFKLDYTYAQAVIKNVVEDTIKIGTITPQIATIPIPKRWRTPTTISSQK